MFIYLFEDGGLVYSKDEPTEADLEMAMNGITTIIKIDGDSVPQEVDEDGNYIDLLEAKLRDNGGSPFHDDPFNDDYEEDLDEEEY